MFEWQFAIPIVLMSLVIFPVGTVAGYRAALRKIDANAVTIRRVYLLRLVGFEGVFFPNMSGYAWLPNHSLPLATHPWRDALILAIILSAWFGGTLLAISLWIEWREQRRGRWRLRTAPREPIQETPEV